MSHMEKTHSASTKINPSSGSLKWINNGYKPNSWGYGKSKSKIACLLGFSQLSDKPHLYFDRIKPFLASRLISHNGGKKMVKMFSTVSNNWGTHFAGQVIQTLANTS